MDLLHFHVCIRPQSAYNSSSLCHSSIAEHAGKKFQIRPCLVRTAVSRLPPPDRLQW
jgi:hypothetical protein